MDRAIVAIIAIIELGHLYECLDKDRIGASAAEFEK